MEAPADVATAPSRECPSLCLGPRLQPLGNPERRVVAWTSSHSRPARARAVWRASSARRSELGCDRSWGRAARPRGLSQQPTLALNEEPPGCKGRWRACAPPSAPLRSRRGVAKAAAGASGGERRVASLRRRVRHWQDGGARAAAALAAAEERARVLDGLDEERRHERRGSQAEDSEQQRVAQHADKAPAFRRRAIFQRADKSEEVERVPQKKEKKRTRSNAVRSR